MDTAGVRRAVRAGPSFLHLARVAGVLTAVLLPGCERSDADRLDMRVNEDAAMDTTPAGTPAPPSLPVVAQETERQSAVALDEWTLAAVPEAVRAGEVTLLATNAGSEVHSLAITGPGVEQRTGPIDPGGTAALTVRLEPGTYRLFCPEEGPDGRHAERGMSAPFAVR